MAAKDVKYADNYRNINFHDHPEQYRIGRGEQGVLIAQPYKSEILPHWRFVDPATARKSAGKIYAMFREYAAEDDCVGMDMARKFLQMGFTRSRRYANHSSGKKYDSEHNVKPQDEQSKTSIKAESARIFYDYYIKAKDDPVYLKLKEKHKSIYSAR